MFLLVIPKGPFHRNSYYRRRKVGHLKNTTIKVGQWYCQWSKTVQSNTTSVVFKVGNV